MSDFKQLTVEGFTLCDGNGATRHFEDVELDHLLSPGPGTQQALVLVQLGLDEADCHVVKVDLTPGGYEDAHAAITEAISALEVIQEQLEAMRSAPEVRAAEKNAFDLGVDAERAGLIVPTQEARS